MASKSSRSTRVFAFLVLVACLPSPAFVGSPSRSPTPRQPHERGLQARRAQATAEFEVGDAVRALHADHQEWYEGVIQGINPDGSYSVQMDTPDYAEWVDVPKDQAEPLFVYKDYRPGDNVLFALEGFGAQPGRVAAVQPRGYYAVQYVHPQRAGAMEKERKTIVHAKDMRIRTRELRPGQRCDGIVEAIDGELVATVELGAEAYGRLSEAEGLEIGQRVQVEVVSIDKEGIEVILADQKAPGAGRRSGRGRRAPSAPVDKRPIRQKMRLNAFADVPSNRWLDGKVVCLLEYGAMVRVWLDSESFADGLVHKTGFKDGPVEEVENALVVGQAVRVRVKRLDLVRQQLEFTMYNFKPNSKSSLSVFTKLPEDHWLKGKVVKLASFGMFVLVEAEGVTAQGMVHIRNAKQGFLPKLEDEFYLGQEVNVRVEYVDLSRQQMGLTMLEPTSG